jgi:hypothetical protein
VVDVDSNNEDTIDRLLKKEIVFLFIEMKIL